MLVQEVAHKYANAMFMSVRAKNLVDRADEQFHALRELLKKDRTLLDFLEAPQIPDDRKLAFLDTVFAKRLDPAMYQFLLVLFHKHRIKYLAEIAEEFDRLVKAERGIGVATVITAVPLTKKEEETLAANLADKTGLSIELDLRVEPDIVGGIIVILHNQIIDGSVRHGLNLIQQQLEKVKVA